MILISDKAFEAMDQYPLQGLTPGEICNRLIRDGFDKMQAEAIRVVLNHEDLRDVLIEEN